MFEDAGSIRNLLESHTALVSDLAALEHLARHLGGCPGPSALDNLAEMVAPLPARLAEHMTAEERDVYPALRTRLGRDIVDDMVADHRTIDRWVGRLVDVCAEGSRERQQLDAIRWTLLVVIGLVNLHLRKEEIAYIGLLARQIEPAPRSPV